MYKTVFLCLIVSSWCDTHDASIHQMFGILLHVMHTLPRNIPPLQSCFTTIHLFQSQKAVSDPLELLLAVQKLLLQSQPVRACIAGKMSTTSVSNSSNIVYTEIANFALLFPAIIQSYFNPE